MKPYIYMAETPIENCGCYLFDTRTSPTQLKGADLMAYTRRSEAFVLALKLLAS